MPRSLLALLALPLIAATAGTTPAGAPLTMVVTGVGAATGAIRVALCPEATFLKPHCPYIESVPATAGSVTITLPNVAPGVYGAQAYWDKNDNGRADRNLFGIPTEMVGFSNDAPVHWAPPRFADAAFRHGETAQRITFRVRKLL